MFPAILALEKWRQVNKKLKIILGYMVNLKQARDICASASEEKNVPHILKVLLTSNK